MSARLTTESEAPIILNTTNYVQLPLVSTDDNGFIQGSLSISGNEVVIGASDIYSLSISVQFEQNDQTPRNTMHFEIRKNGSLLAGTANSFLENDPISLSCSTLESLQVGDRISVWIQSSQASPRLIINTLRYFTYLTIERH